jgi:hypothetical protein
MRSHHSRPYFADCARTIPRALLEPIRTQFREADAPEKVRAALQALEEAMGPDVPPLLPLALTD